MKQVSLMAILLPLLLQHTGLQGQNLVPNGGFETRLLDPEGVPYCPQGAGEMEIAVGWWPLLSVADYLHTCSTTIYTGIPQNRSGYQHTYQGEAYVSIGSYVLEWAGLSPREFLFVELAAPLKAGYGYDFEGWVSLLDSMNFAMSGFGALFSVDDLRDFSHDSLMNRHPQVINPYDSLLDDKENWMKVGGYFVAAGGEKYMTIGFFRKDEDDNIQRVSDHPQATYNWEGSGYYVDGLALYEVSGLSTAEPEAAMLQLHPNPTTGEVALHYTTTHNGPLQWQVTDMAGRVVHVQSLQGPTGRASLGKTLPSGVYISTLRTNEAGLGSIKLVVL